MRCVDFGFIESKHIGNESGDKVGQEIIGGSVSGMGNVAGMFEDIDDGFHDPSFAKQLFFQ